MKDGITRREMIGASALVLTLAAGNSIADAQAPNVLSPRERQRLRSWRFHLGHAADVEKDFGFGRDQRTFAKAGVAANAAMPKFDDGDWAEIIVPHDWAIGLPFAEGPPAKGSDRGASHGFKAIGRDFPENSIGWYRTQIDITAADRDRRLSLEFDGVFRDCLIFVNGYIAGRNESGYAPFEVEIGDFLDYSGGPNILTVRCDATLGEGWFYEGAGIYRHVDLVRTHNLHIPQWGTFIRSEVAGNRARLFVTTEVANSSIAPAKVLFRQHIVDDHHRIVAECEEAHLDLTPGQTLTHEAGTFVDAPSLWSIDDPRLYTMISEVLVGGTVVDRYETRFGIRSIRFDAERGFFLNGRPLKLLGTANHQDHAGVGAAIPDELHRWRVVQLQSMGSNAWRSAHNSPASALLDACDEMGMLMIVEQRYNSSDPEAVSQLERTLRRDRNHPCVILWSLGNEEPHQATARGARINAELQQHVRRLDPTRPTTFAMDQGWDNGVGRVVDVLGFNYRTSQIEGYHHRHPEQPVIGTETGSTVATRGEYSNDPAKHIVRAYDTEHPWWATTAEEWWTIVADRPYIAGGFIWTGFDYRGEPTPFDALPSISSQFGILDTCGFPKDDYYYYRAWWRPDRPLVHLLPHWNWGGREGQPIEVWVHGNAEEVELKLNGRSYGRKAMPRNRHLVWRVPYAPGRLEAIGYDRGRVAVRDVRETTGPAHAVGITLDRRLARPDEIVIANAAVLDARGRLVPTADNMLRFSASGGTVIGVGNGNPNSLEPDVANHRQAFNGLAQAIVRVTSPGPVEIDVAGDGMAGSRVRIIPVPEIKA